VVSQNSSVSLAKFLGVVLFVSLWVYLAGELIYPFKLLTVFSYPINQKIKIYSSSLFPFIISVKFGLPLTNLVSVG